MGPSGSGKSTLLHCLAGLDTLTSGAVYIGDTYLARLNDKQLTELRRSKVGFIFQAYNLIPTLTAEENIMLPLMLGGEDGDRQWIDRVIRTVGLEDRLKHRPSELSGGQQQRVAVARALASQPDDHLRRRADRQPRLARPAPRSSTFMRRAVHELRPDDRDGHPRPDRRRLRRPRRVPGRRQDRRRDGRPDRRAGHRPHRSSSATE